MWIHLGDNDVVDFPKTNILSIQTRNALKSITIKQQVQGLSRDIYTRYHRSASV